MALAPVTQAEVHVVAAAMALAAQVAALEIEILCLSTEKIRVGSEGTVGWHLDSTSSEYWLSASLLHSEIFKAKWNPTVGTAVDFKKWSNHEDTEHRLACRHGC